MRIGTVGLLVENSTLMVQFNLGVHRQNGLENLKEFWVLFSSLSRQLLVVSSPGYLSFFNRLYPECFIIIISYSYRLLFIFASIYCPLFHCMIMQSVSVPFFNWDNEAKRYLMSCLNSHNSSVTEFKPELSSDIST